MNRHLLHALSSVAVLASFALGAKLARPAPEAAAPAQGGTPIERLEVIEKQLTVINAKITALEKAKPGQVAADTGNEAIEKQLAAVVDYLNAQADSAKQLDVALNDSREKGFTYGINPDSRIVLLQGFGDFTRSLQTNVPASTEPAARGEGAGAGIVR